MRRLLKDKRLRNDVWLEIRTALSDASAAGGWTDDELATVLTRVIIDGLLSAAIERIENQAVITMNA